MRSLDPAGGFPELNVNRQWFFRRSQATRRRRSL
jgi:hypothetical protein